MDNIYRVASRVLLLICLSSALVACGSSRWGDSGGSLCDSTMVRMGSNTYMAAGKYGAGCGHDYGIRHASVFCAEKGKESLVQNLAAENQVIFKCLSPGDPELENPTYEQVPDIQVEVR